MDRIALSDRIFKLSWAVTKLPTTLREAAGRMAERAAVAAGSVLRRLGAGVRGCGCTDDDPECCDRKNVTDPKYRSWCKCDCHDGNAVFLTHEITDAKPN